MSAVTPKNLQIRGAIVHLLAQPHREPALWENEAGGPPINGWLDTDQIADLVIMLVSGASHASVYPQLRALANKGEIQYWPAHQALPLTDRTPTAEEQKRYGRHYRAHWRIVPTAAPLHDPALLEEWLAS